MPVDASTALEEWVRPVQDWPVPGVTFRDLTPLFARPEPFAAVIDALVDIARSAGPVDRVLGVEARGFIVGAPVALELGVGFVPVRKAGKLPHTTLSASYALEYGEATIEMHADAVAPGDRVLVIDDVLATGGTLAATADLVREAGGEVVADLVIIELPALGGRAVLGDVPVHSLTTY